MTKEDEKRIDFREFRIDTIKLFILQLLLVWGFIVLLVIFWDKLPVKVVAFLISIIAWYKYWTGKIKSALNDKWEHKVFEDGLELLRRKQPKSKEEMKKETLETYDAAKELISLLIHSKKVVKGGATL